MAIRKAYEISCDECGAGEPAFGNRSDLERMWKAHGWVFVGDKHFCDAECAKKHCKPNGESEGLTNGEVSEYLHTLFPVC